MKPNVIVKLSDIEHVLKRPARYVSSVKPIKQDLFVWNEETNQIQRREVEYVPALIKIVREAIDNAIDEAIRTGFEHANKIDIYINVDGSIHIRDNGRGIPVTKNEHGVYSPELAWCELRAGSNFGDEEDNTTIGQNGEGVAILNIFSKKFIGETSDGENRFKIVCSDNLKNRRISIKSSKLQYTSVWFIPDYERFSVEGFDQIHFEILKTDIMNLAVSFPQIRFKLNGRQIKFPSFKHYASLYSERVEILDSENLKIAVFSSPSDDFQFVHFINGVNVWEGGNPMNWVTWNTVNRLKENLKRKYKSIKPGDVKNHLSIVAFFFNMKNPRFDNQVKTKCINTVTDFGDAVSDVNWDEFVKRILRRNEIIDPIIDLFKMKEELKQRQQLKNLSAKPKKIRVDKYIPAIEKQKYLVLTEGDSASSGISQVLGRENFGYFPLRGKPLNCLEVSLSRIVKNEEVKNVFQILNLIPEAKIQEEISYEKVLFATDQDLDGISIRGLLVALFYRFTPDLLKKGRVAFLRTPLIAGKKNGKIVCYFFTFQEYQKFLKEKETRGIVFHYYKGLGTWKKEDLKSLIDQDGIENFIIDFEFDKEAEKLIKDWLGRGNSLKRQGYLRGKSFDINKM